MSRIVHSLESKRLQVTPPQVQERSLVSPWPVRYLDSVGVCVRGCLEYLYAAVVMGDRGVREPRTYLGYELRAVGRWREVESKVAVLGSYPDDLRTLSIVSPVYLVNAPWL